MLIVVVVLVTLMTMTFRLSSLGGDSTRYNRTIARLQRLENCLSGYYAAYGTYPPVALHGDRNPWLKVSTHGIQNDSGIEDTNIFGWDAEKFRAGTLASSESTKEAKAWEQVEAACRSQPVDCAFPFPQQYSEFVEAKSEQLKEYAEEYKSSISENLYNVLSAGFDDGVSKNIGRFGSYQDETEWNELQLFKFGLMSYLLPRFLVMMGSHESIYEDYEQWTQNNAMPCDALTGKKYNNWREVCSKVTSNNNRDVAEIANNPSQAVCARWMANLEGIVNTARGSLSLFGVSLSSGENSYNPSRLHIYTPGGYAQDGGTGGQYILDSCTVWDGWDHEFFYYSPAPYQTYVLWSAGKNKRTFPPWIARDGLDPAANRCIGAWIEDDIVSMSH